MPSNSGVIGAFFGGLLSLIFFLLIYAALAVAAVTVLSLVTVVALFQRGSRFAGLGIATLVILALAVPYLALSMLFKDYFGWWLILMPCWSSPSCTSS